MGAAVDLTGQRFVRWLVIARGEPLTKDRRPTWLCKCDCGTEKTVLGASLKNGDSKSCGCFSTDKLRALSTTHGMTLTPEHISWKAMMARCRNENRKDYPEYGGRGIVVCERWLKFENFFADMGPKPSPGHSLDRIDANGNYEPGNCRWATASAQQRNKRNSVLISFNGLTLSAADWADRLGISRKVICQRVRQGLPVSAVLRTE